jgi:hypothetical protein
MGIVTTIYIISALIVAAHRFMNFDKFVEIENGDKKAAKKWSYKSVFWPGLNTYLAITIIVEECKYLYQKYINHETDCDL